MNPTYKITANDTDITDQIRANFVSLSCSDSAGIESDTLSIAIHDDGSISWPTKGAVLSFWLGFKGSLYFKGKYTVGDLEHVGPPDQIIIHANANDMRGLGKIKRNRSYINKTLFEIITIVGSRLGLVPAVSEQFKDVVHPALYQVDESDTHFMTRLAQLYDAVTKTKSGYLVFISRAEAITAGGNDMPIITLARNETAAHNYTESGRNEYTRTSAAYYLIEPAVIDGETMNVRKYYIVYSGSDTGTTKNLPGYYTSEAEAQRAADAEFYRLDRSASTFSVELQLGRPDIGAEMMLKPTGFRARVSELDWVIDNVEHTLDASGGLSTSINCAVLQTDE